MRYLFLSLLLALPLPAIALTGPAARFDFSLGQPAITADNTNTCNDTATVRFDFSLGQPAQVFDATANCTAAAAAGGAVDDIIWFE